MVIRRSVPLNLNCIAIALSGTCGERLQHALRRHRAWSPRSVWWRKFVDFLFSRICYRPHSSFYRRTYHFFEVRWYKPLSSLSKLFHGISNCGFCEKRFRWARDTFYLWRPARRLRHPLRRWATRSITFFFWRGILHKFSASELQRSEDVSWQKEQHLINFVSYVFS